MSKNKKYNYSGGETARINLSLDDLERLPLRDLISKSPGELFALQKLISRDFGRARSRREWLRNIIELKYQGILEKLRRKATEHFKHPLSSDRVCYFLWDGDFQLKLEFVQPRDSKIELRLFPMNNSSEVSDDQQ